MQGSSSPSWIDSHAHLSFPTVFPSVQEILSRAYQSHLSHIINICTDQESLKKGLQLAQSTDLSSPRIYNAAATHPHEVEQEEGKSFFPIAAEAAQAGFLKAIGETGLDYYYKDVSKEAQKHFLKRYLHLALECHLPVIIHCREAFSDLFEILDAGYTLKNGSKILAPGVLHCFTGSLQEAKEVLKRGWYLSLSGIVTFKKSEALREVAKIVPLNQLLIETDTPYLAPQSHRGKMNEPSYLPETAAVIASIKGIFPEEVAKATSENAKQLFHLED